MIVLLIKLNRKNPESNFNPDVLLNVHDISTLDSLRDGSTLITLTSGREVLVKESLDEVKETIIELIDTMNDDDDGGQYGEIEWAHDEEIGDPEEEEFPEEEELR